MDWGAIDTRNAVLAICEHWDIEFAQARDYLLAQQLRQAEECAAAGVEQQEQEEKDDADQIIPMPGQDLVSVSALVVGTGEAGFQDGAAAAARLDFVAAMLHLPDGRVLVADQGNNRIRMLSADLQQASTVAGDGEYGHQDGAAAQAQFRYPAGLALLPDGRVLVVDFDNNRIRMLSADLQQVSTVAGDGERGHQDGAAAQAQFYRPASLALLPDGRVLVADQFNHRLRLLSADLQQVSTVAGDGEDAHRDGAAAQAQFRYPTGLALLPDGRVLVADKYNHRIRMLSADLQQVSTVAGDGTRGHRGGAAAQRHRDGAAALARFRCPERSYVLPDGRVLLTDRNDDTETTCIRVLSADLQKVSTLTNVDELYNPEELCLLPDGRLLVSDDQRIRVLEGFPAELLGAKPSHKKPKKTKQQLLQEKTKRALAGGASSSSSSASSCGPVPKRSRSGASSSRAAAALSSSDDSEGEEQSSGRTEPLV
jgi:DNA-binding beta-propeller fold protein YncE